MEPTRVDGLLLKVDYQTTDGSSVLVGYTPFTGKVVLDVSPPV
jgi:hypothetical protein